MPYTTAQTIMIGKSEVEIVVDSVRKEKKE
jgi:hypothetical protein